MTDLEYNSTNSPSDTSLTQKSGFGTPSLLLLILTLIPLVGIVLALTGFFDSNAGNGLSQLTRPQPANYAAPQFFLTDLSGNSIRLSDYEGQVVFVNFWQTTCPPCIRELPAFAEFASAHEAIGDAAVLAINFDETTEQIQNFLDENGIDGVDIALDPISQYRRAYGVEQIPTTYLIDGNGQVRYVKLGEMTVDLMEELLAQLKTDQT